MFPGNRYGPVQVRIFKIQCTYTQLCRKEMGFQLCRKEIDMTLLFSCFVLGFLFSFSLLVTREDNILSGKNVSVKVLRRPDHPCLEQLLGSNRKDSLVQFFIRLLDWR